MNITDTNIKDLTALVQKASLAIMDIYNSNSAVVEWKSDKTPLTQADKHAHEIIVEGLGRLFPEIPVVSEEGSEEESAKLVSEPRFWLVDPIDGTREFVDRTGEFCIAIGLIEDNKPTFGFVVAPTLDTIYYGGPAMGSYKKVGGAEPEQIRTKNLSPDVVAVSRSHPNNATLNFIESNYPEATRRTLGSMLKQMKLAEGEASVYPSISQPLHLWDAAAGNAIIEGAGGVMTRPDGSPLDYSVPSLKTGDFIARAS